MREQLSGRALDEACARTMGWVQSDDWPDFLPEFRWIASGKSIPEELPEFSDDAETIPEMCAWLRERRLRWVVAEFGDGLILAQTFAGIVLHEIDRATGATLNEALARLVVAVAAAKEK